MPYSGKLIVIEGLEGAGKSTAIHTLLNYFANTSIKVLTVREPGGTAIGETIRSLLKNTGYKDFLDARAELLLFYAARIQLVQEVIIPALKKGTWVIADRFELSTFAYQGGGRGLDPAFIKQLSAFSLQGFTPNLTFFLDIKPEAGLLRIKQRGEYDRIEQESLEFFNKIYNAYQKFLKDTPNTRIIDASKPLLQVQSQLIGFLKEYIATQTHE